MFAFIVRRLLYIGPLLIGVTLLTFLLFDVVGGDPCYQLVGKHQSETAFAQCRERLGLNDAMPVRYMHYIQDLFALDFGRSFTTNQSVKEILISGMGPSLAITLPAFVIGTTLSILFALLVSYFRGRIIDRVAVFFCVCGMSVTVLAYIIFGQYFLAYKMQLFPISGYEPGFAVIPYVVLPIIIWVSVGLGYDVRFFRTCILDESGKDYVRTAAAKGASKPQIYLKHILKNALIPIITHVIIQIPFLITGSLLLENFFQIPGLGNAVIRAINDSDLPVLKAMVFLGALAFTIFHLITDVCYVLVDPRIRVGGGSKENAGG